MRRLTSTGLLKSNWKHTCVGSGALKDTLNKQDFLPPPPQKCHQVFKKILFQLQRLAFDTKVILYLRCSKMKKSDLLKNSLPCGDLIFVPIKTHPQYFFSKAKLQGGSKSCQRLPDCVLISIWSLSTLGFRTIELWFCLLFTTMHENKPL